MCKLFEVFLLLLALGFIIGVPASMVGLGGGFLIVPTLILIFGLPARNAVAVSLLAMSGTTISAAVGYIRQGRVDYKLALLYDILDVPGVVLGAYLTRFFPSDTLTGLCGLFVMFIALLLARKQRAVVITETSRAGNTISKGWRRRIRDFSGEEFEYIIRSPFMALISSFSGGLVTGLGGLGGGITDTITMVLLGVPPHVAVASSELAMALTNGVGVAAHGLLANLLLEYAIPITIGTVIGAQLGSSLSKRVKAEALRRVLSLIAFLLGLRLLLFIFEL